MSSRLRIAGRYTIKIAYACQPNPTGKEAAIVQSIKNLYRRWQLRRRGIVQHLQIEAFSAGDRSGVWVVDPTLLTRDSVVYSFGVGDNLAWELAMIQRFGLTVHAFDPTPASIAWVERQSLPPTLVFHPSGLAAHDGNMGFAPRRPGSRINYRPIAEAGVAVIECPVARLATFMQDLDHECIDVLKMDIEGGEYAVLNDLLSKRVKVRQLLVEFHHHFPGIGIEATASAVRSLQDAGYRIFHISERALEFSFLFRP